MRYAALVLLAGLSGCLAPYEAMKNNQYAQVDPQPAPTALVGTWTGTSGPYLMTVKMGADGRGLSCASWQANESLNNVKYSGGRLYFPDGMQMAVSIEAETLMATYDSKDHAPIQLWPDPQLVDASPYCQGKLR